MLGLRKCLPPVCPVDCILPDPEWKPAPDEWWDEQKIDDPYADPTWMRTRSIKDPNERT